MAIIPKEQAPEGLKPGTVMQLSNGMPVSGRAGTTVVCWSPRPSPANSRLC